MKYAEFATTVMHGAVVVVCLFAAMLFAELSQTVRESREASKPKAAPCCPAPCPCVPKVRDKPEAESE